MLTDLGDVLWGLAHRLEDVNGGRQVDVFEVAHCVGVGARVLHLGDVVHHLGLKLGVHRARLNHGQPDR